jgi:hypothetical protein
MNWHITQQCDEHSVLYLNIKERLMRVSRCTLALRRLKYTAYRRGNTPNL